MSKVQENLNDPIGDDPTKTPTEMPESLDVGDFANLSAHDSFTNLNPTVFNEHKQFMNNLELNEKTNVTDNFNPKQSESVINNTKPNFMNSTANCKSEFIPQINQRKYNDDDDNNNNKTKMIEVNTDQNNSILARIELGLLLAEMKSQVNETLVCNEQGSNDLTCNTTFTY